MKSTLLPLLCSLPLLLPAKLAAQQPSAPPPQQAQAVDPAAAPAPVAVESATIPVPRAGTARTRYELLNERVKQNAGKIDILFVGDSITQGWEVAGAAAWEKFYGKRKAVNIGSSGDRTQHVLWRLDNGNADGLSPKAAVLMIGTNNSGLDRNSPSEMLEGVTAVVGKLREKFPGAKILLLGIFPRSAQFSEQRGKILQVNQALRKLDDGRSVYFLDIGEKFIEPDGSISKEIMPDALHLSPAGYLRWAGAIEPKLSELLRAPAAQSPRVGTRPQARFQARSLN